MDSPAAIFKLLKGLATPKNDPNDLTVIDLQVGRQVHRKVPGHMRTELWLSVLHRKGIGAAYAAQYRSMLAKGVSAEVYSDIEKDVGRTFPGSPRFTSPEGQRALLNVLQAYAAYDEEVNYCQGMNFLAALMLTWLPREAEAFGALVLVMKDRGLRELYKSDMQMLQARLWQVGKLMPQKLARHMEDHLAIPVLYASSWLLTAFASDFPIFFASRVMDIILTDRYVVAIMKVVVGILQRCEARLLEMTDMERMVAFLKVEVPQWRHDTLQEILTAALASEWTPKQALILERTENVESVVDAVQRVAAQLPQGEAADDDGEEEAGPEKKASKLASFTWASKLSDASSPGASALQPGLLESLTGTFAGLPSMISDAAHSVSSNMTSNLGDLLGLSEEKPHPAPAGTPPHQQSGSAAAAAAQRSAPKAEENVSTGPDADGEYLAALSMAASNSTGDASGLVKRLNTHALDPAQLRGGSASAPSRPVSLALAESDELSDAAQARSSTHSTDRQHSRPADNRSAPVSMPADGSSAAVSRGSFSPSLCVSPPSSPFKESHGSSQLQDISEQLQQSEGDPPQHGQRLQGRPTNLNRKSGGSLASRQSLGGPSDSCVSWGSFRSPDESRSALEPLQQELDTAHSGPDSARGIDDVQGRDSTDHAGCQADSSEQSMHQPKDASSIADRPDASRQSEQNAARLFLVDMTDVDDNQSESSAAEDPFRVAESEDMPAVHQQRMRADRSRHVKRPSLSRWEMQQLSGFAVSGDLDGAAQAGPRKGVDHVVHPR